MNNDDGVVDHRNYNRNRALRSEQHLQNAQHAHSKDTKGPPQSRPLPKSDFRSRINSSDIPSYPFRSFSSPAQTVEPQSLRPRPPTPTANSTYFGPSTGNSSGTAVNPLSATLQSISDASNIPPSPMEEYDNYFGRSLPNRLDVDVNMYYYYSQLQGYPDGTSTPSSAQSRSLPMYDARFIDPKQQVAYSSLIHDYYEHAGGGSESQYEQSGPSGSMNTRAPRTENPSSYDQDLRRYASSNNFTIQQHQFDSHQYPAQNDPYAHGASVPGSQSSLPEHSARMFGSFDNQPRPSPNQYKDNFDDMGLEEISSPRTPTTPQQSVKYPTLLSKDGSSGASTKRSAFFSKNSSKLHRSKSLPDVSNNPLIEAAAAAEALRTAPSNSSRSDPSTSHSSSNSSGADQHKNSPTSSRAISFNYPQIHTDPSTSTRLGLYIPSPQSVPNPAQFSSQHHRNMAHSYYQPVEPARTFHSTESNSSRSQPLRSFDLKSIVASPPMLRYFRMLVSATTAEENLEYLLALKLLAESHARVEDYLAPEMLSDLLCDGLLDIQAKFLLDGSPMELNLAGGLRRSVNEAVMWRVWDAGRDGGRRLVNLRDVIDTLAPVTKEISILMQPLVRAFNASIDRVLQSEQIQHMPYKRHVIVVGGGFAGVTCAMTLDTVPDFHVTLIDTKEFFEFTPAFAKTLVNPSIDTIRLHHTDILQNGTFLLGSCDAIGANSIRVNSRVLGFHYLVIATGSSYGNEIKSRGASHAFRIKQLSHEYAELKDATSVLVAGGGLVGVEIAAEIATHFPDRSRKAITLVESGASLLRRNHPKAHDIALKRLKDMGVKVIFNTRVATVTAMSSGGAVLLSEGIGGTRRARSTARSSNTSLRSEFDLFGSTEDADPDFETVSPLSSQPTDTDWLAQILRQPNEYNPPQPSPPSTARTTPRPPSSTTDPTRYSNSRANRTRYLILTDSRHRILVDKVYIATGPRPNSAAMAESMARCVDVEGYIRVEGSMQVVGLRNIFAVGDVVDVDEEKTFWGSCMEGINTAKNIQRVEAGKKPVFQGTGGYPKPNTTPVIQLISLGNKEAIAIFNRSIVRCGPFFLKMKNKAEEDFMNRLKNHLPFPFIFGRMKTG